MNKASCAVVNLSTVRPVPAITKAIFALEAIFANEAIEFAVPESICVNRTWLVLTTAPELNPDIAPE